jgi:hypothetical protein
MKWAQGACLRLVAERVFDGRVLSARARQLVRNTYRFAQGGAARVMVRIPNAVSTRSPQRARRGKLLVPGSSFLGGVWAPAFAEAMADRPALHGCLWRCLGVVGWNWQARRLPYVSAPQYGGWRYFSRRRLAVMTTRPPTTLTGQSHRICARTFGVGNALISGT